MKNKIWILLTIIGLTTLISCEKDETKILLSASPTAPTLSLPSDNIVLKRTEASDTLSFTGALAEYGFVAAESYKLEVISATGSFDSPTVVATTTNANSFKVAVGDFNAKMLSVPLNADESATIKVRVTSYGLPGVDDLHSPELTMTVTPYGYPKLVLSTTPSQNIYSQLGDGNYTGFAKLPAGTPFTMTDPDAGKVYGGSGGVLVENGDSFSVSTEGWYKISASTVNMDYTIKSFMIGLVGSATPNGWNAPDLKMDYNATGNYWYITTDLVAGEVKFRMNDAWDWNLGGTESSLSQGGANLPISEAGNYTIKLYLSANEQSGSCTIVKN